MLKFIYRGDICVSQMLAHCRKGEITAFFDRLFSRTRDRSLVDSSNLHDGEHMHAHEIIQIESKSSFLMIKIVKHPLV